MNIDTFLKDKTVEFVKNEVTTSEPKEPTKTQLQEAFELLKNVQANNGFTAIAMKTKVPRHLIMELHKKMTEKVVITQPEDLMDLTK